MENKIFKFIGIKSKLNYHDNRVNKSYRSELFDKYADCFAEFKKKCDHVKIVDSEHDKDEKRKFVIANP